MAIFFRDPVRVVPTAPGLVVSPADGRVEPIVRAVPPPELGLGEARLARVSIFMNVFDCHINRAPVAGRVARIAYKPGKFLSADLDKASEENERNALVIESESGSDVGVVQIAGLVARRIVCWTKEGAGVAAGERIGMIRFGSRLDVYLPEGSTIVVERGPAGDRRRDGDRGPAGREPRAALSDAARLGRTMASLFPPVDPEAKRGRPRRRLVPFTAVLPNLVTLLGLCAGLTAIRMAVEHRFDLAVAAIIFAIILDGIDGRLARYFRATSRFGEQLDSLADFVNFGVAPALFVFVWRLDELSSFGWICALVFAICTGPAARSLQRGAPRRGAATRLEPRFLRRRAGAGRGGADPAAVLPAADRLSPTCRIAAVVVALYTILIALLMVSRIPTLSGKRFGRRIPRDKVLPVLVIGVLLVALLASYPFSFLAVTALAYLAHIPFAWRARNRAEARAAQHLRDDAQRLEE